MKKKRDRSQAGCVQVTIAYLITDDKVDEQYLLYIYINHVLYVYMYVELSLCNMHLLCGISPSLLLCT